MSQENIPPPQDKISRFVRGHVRSMEEFSRLTMIAQSQSKDANPTQPLINVPSTPQKKNVPPMPPRRPPRRLRPELAQQSSPAQMPSRVLVPIPSVANEQYPTIHTVHTPYLTANTINHVTASQPINPAKAIPQQVYCPSPAPPPSPTPGSPAPLIPFHLDVQPNLVNTPRALQPRFDSSVSSNMDGVLEGAIATSMKRPASSANVNPSSSAKRSFPGNSSFTTNLMFDMDEAPRKQLENEIWGDCDDEDVLEATMGFEQDLAATGESAENREDFIRLIQSIPLEESHKDEVDVSETVSAGRFLNCVMDKLGNPVVPGMKVFLMPHQLLGVKWMVERENEPSMGEVVRIDEEDAEKTYGKMTKANTVGGGLLADEMGLGKTIQSIALMVHNRAPRDEAVKSTLIVAPKALLRQWKREIERKTSSKKNKRLTVHIHHGNDKLNSIKEFAQYDVVLTTYGTVLAAYPTNKIEVRKRMTQMEKAANEEWIEEHSGLIFKVRWYRIILDEAHVIKNQYTRGSRACCALKSPRKWCLTGTPFHNGLNDIYPIFKFLEVPCMNEFGAFKKSFLTGSPKEGATKMQLILRGLCLRRRKDGKINGQSLIVLPEKTITEARLQFSKEERLLYEQVQGIFQDRINFYLKKGLEAAKEHRSGILAMLVRLRQVCIHPFLVMQQIAESWTEREIEQAVTDVAQGNLTNLYDKLVTEMTAVGDVTECTICLDEFTDPIITPCRHVFCKECIYGVFENPAAHGQVDGDENIDVEEVGIKIACPACRARVSRDELEPYLTPEERKKQKLDDDMAIALYEDLKNKCLDSDDSDEESLPDDLASALLQKAPSKTAKRERTISSSRGICSSPTRNQDIIEIDSDEDLFEVFRRDPVPLKDAQRNHHRNMPQHWAALLYQHQWLPSTKLMQLRDQLDTWRRESVSDKIIIFSQFVRALDLVQRVCEMEGWRWCRYHGEMRLDEREETLERFEEDEDMQFMLTSIKCGGVGLNLTMANRVVILDVWWNWQIEHQAIDRAHRTGQTKPMSVSRIIVEETVEERILELQESKKEIASTALGDEERSRVKRLGFRQLLGLFGHVHKDKEGNLRID